MLSREKPLMSPARADCEQRTSMPPGFLEGTE